MIYRPQTINFREVVVGDTLYITLEMSPAYEVTPETHIYLEVRATGDIPQDPVLTLDSLQGEITKDGQKITLHKELTQVRPGRFVHQIKFTKAGITSTLYIGLFEIFKDSTLLL